MPDDRVRSEFTALGSASRRRAPGRQHPRRCRRRQACRRAASRRSGGCRAHAAVLDRAARPVARAWRGRGDTRQACAATRVVAAEVVEKALDAAEASATATSPRCLPAFALGQLRDRTACSRASAALESSAIRSRKAVPIVMWKRSLSAEPSTSRPKVAGPRRPAAAALRDSGRDVASSNHVAASKPTLEPQNGTRMLLARRYRVAVTGRAQSGAAYCGRPYQRRSAQCGTLKTFFSRHRPAFLAAAPHPPVAAELGSRRPARAIASFSWPLRTMSATRDSSALMRSRSINDWRSTSEIAWPLVGMRQLQREPAVPGAGRRNPDGRVR